MISTAMPSPWIFIWTEINKKTVSHDVINFLPWILHTINKGDIMHITCYHLIMNMYSCAVSHSDTVSYTIHIATSHSQKSLNSWCKVFSTLVDVLILCTVSQHTRFQNRYRVCIIIRFCFRSLPPVNRSKFSWPLVVTYYGHNILIILEERHAI